MELRQYWRIVSKRIWIVIALVLVVLIGSLALRSTPPPDYQASMRFLVGISPETPTGDDYTYDRYYTWLASEYLADDFSEVVKYSAFAQDVTAHLAKGDTPLIVPAGAIQGATVAEKQHRILTLRITWDDPDQLMAIAEAAAQVLRDKGPGYFAQVGATGAEITLIDAPVVVPMGLALRERLDLPIRLFLALLAGLALTFLVDYLDDTIRDREEVEAMGLTVLGEIPPLPGGRWPPWRRQRLP
ncbi:MAG: YveK family protein [Anaerolineae bacterium]